MPRNSSRQSRLKAEDQEAHWYATEEGRRHTSREFARALRAGTISRSQGLKVAKTDSKVLRQLMEEAKESATRPISIRIPIADLERAERIAKRLGVGYQTVLKQAIREGLKKTG